MDRTGGSGLLCPCSFTFISNYTRMVRILSGQCLYGYDFRAFFDCNGIFWSGSADSNSIGACRGFYLPDVGQHGRGKAMRAIRLSFFHMAVIMRRDMMLSVSCLAPVFAGVFFKFAIPYIEAVLTDGLHRTAIIAPYYGLVDILLAMLPPAMFCFVSAMVSLEEADEKTAAYLFITPLTKTGYLSARLGLPAVAAFFVTLILLPVFKLTALPSLTILLLTAGATLQGVIVALLILTISSNKLEGVAVAKLATLTVFGAAVPFFIQSNVQYAISPLPAFWIGKAILESRPVYMLPAFGLSIVWIFFFLKSIEADVNCRRN